MTNDTKIPEKEKPVLKQGLRKRLSGLTSPSIRQPKKESDCNCGKRKSVDNEK